MLLIGLPPSDHDGIFARERVATATCLGAGAQGGVATRNHYQVKGFLLGEAAGRAYDPMQPHLVAVRPPEVAGDNEMGMPGGVVLFRRR